MTDRHTPAPPYTETPWHTANAKVNVYDSSGDVIGNFRHEEDTVFAIRACNSHEALVKALKACMIRLVQVDERFRKHTGAEPAGELGEITRAKAALKLLDDAS